MKAGTQRVIITVLGSGRAWNWRAQYRSGGGDVRSEAGTSITRDVAWDDAMEAAGRLTIEEVAR